MSRLGSKVHRQVVLQWHMDRGKVVVEAHIGQRGYIRCRDGAHVEGEVVEYGPYWRQREGRVDKGILRDLWLGQILWDRPWQGLDPLDFLWRLLQGGPDAFEGVF